MHSQTTPIENEYDFEGSNVGPVVPQVDWQRASVVLLFKVPREERTTGDQKLWNKWTRGDLTGRKLVPQTANAIDENIAKAGNLRGLSVRWYGTSAAKDAISISGPEQNHSTSSLPRKAFAHVPEISALRDAGILIMGISRTRGDADHEYIAVHLYLSDAALANPEWVPAALHRSTKVTGLLIEGNQVFSGENLQEAINVALSASGIRAKLDHAGGIRSISGGPSFHGQIYTISTAAPASRLPERNCGGHEEKLDLATQWAHALAIAQSPTPTPTLSDLSPAGILRAQISLGAAVAWSSDRGLGIVAQSAPLGDQALWAAENAHVVTLAHSVFIDLAVLVMQQSDFLDLRAKRLSELANSNNFDLSGNALDKYQEIQKDYLKFLGQSWIQEIPRRESATRVLQGMQNARHLEERIKHTAIEQSAMLDYLATSERAAAEKARIVEQKAQEDARETEKIASESRAKSSHRINLIAYIFLPASLVFTVTGGTGTELNGTGIAMSIAITFLLTAILFGVEYHQNVIQFVRKLLKKAGK